MSEANNAGGEQASGGGAGGTSSDHINIKVQAQDGSVIHFKIKRHTQLRKLMHAYCDRLGLRVDAVRFMFDDKRVQESDTPNELQMEEGDTIEVYQPQTGGCV